MADENVHVLDQLPDQNRGVDDNFTWIRYPFGVRLNSEPANVLHSIIEMEEFIMEDDLDKDTLTKYLEVLKGSMTSEIGGLGSEYNKNNITSDQEVNYYFNQPNFEDTRVGCNEAINPYWQFNRDDDICPPSLIPVQTITGQNLSTQGGRYSQSIAHASGMGRVYAETYNSQQQIVWFEAGVPKFHNLIDYYRDAADSTVAEAINSGTFSNIGRTITSWFLNLTAFVFTGGLISVVWLSRWTSQAVDDRVTKYYSFKSTMTMYYSIVNSLLQYTAVSMGLHPLTLKSKDGPSLGSGMINNMDRDHPNTEKQTYDVWEKVTTTDQSGKSETKYEHRTIERQVPPKKGYSDYAGIPELLKDGPDIFKIMNRRSRMIDMANAKYSVSDLIVAENDHNRELMLEPDQEAKYKEGEGWSLVDSVENGVSEWWSSLKGSVMGSGNHVGFKLEKGISFTESITNQSEETGLAAQMNNASNEKRKEQNVFGNGFAASMAAIATNIGEGGKILDVAKNTFIDKVKKEGAKALAEMTGFDIGKVLLTGNGFLEIPKVWGGSTTDMGTVSMSFRLRSRYGDPVSIFQSIYIPLFLLLALAAPRAVGSHAYASPFLVRVFCKGMFHIPLGLISSLQITRGGDEHGWSDQFLPLSVDVQVQVENLCPQLYLSMNNGIFDTFTRNTQMQAYLDVLSSLGLKDMIYWWPKVCRKTATALAIARSTVFNPTYHGTLLGKSKLGKLASCFIPYKNDRASTN